MGTWIRVRRRSRCRQYASDQYAARATEVGFLESPVFSQDKTKTDGGSQRPEPGCAIGMMESNDTRLVSKAKQSPHVFDHRGTSATSTTTSMRDGTLMPANNQTHTLSNQVYDHPTTTVCGGATIPNGVYSDRHGVRDHSTALDTSSRQQPIQPVAGNTSIQLGANFNSIQFN